MFWKKNKDNIDIKMHIAENYIKIAQGLRAESALKSVLKIDPENRKAKEFLRQCV